MVYCQQDICKMEKLTTKQRLLLIGLLFIEAIIMFWIVPKANADDIDMQLWLIIDISLALIISLAVLIKNNQGNRKSIIPIFIVCVATYLQILYCSVFYDWGILVSLTLPIFQIMFGYAIFRYSNDIVSLFIGCSNLMFSAIWANQYQGFLWFHNKSNDLETIAVTSVCAIIGVWIVLAISSLMIFRFHKLEHHETDR